MSAVRALTLWVALTLSGQSFCAGQGFKPSETRVVGSDNSYDQLAQQYSNSRSWQNSYKHNPKSACRKAGGSNLCAASATNTADAYAQLVMAASPSAYNSANERDVGGVRVIAGPQDQNPCDTCAAMAVASAAESAIASIERVNVADGSISPQALHFCPPGNQPGRECDGGWTLPSTLSLLQQYSQQLPTAACMPYKPDVRGDMAYSEFCNKKCDTPNPYLSQGRFNYKQILSVWRAQQHIRQYGSIVTRFDILDDFMSFFSNPANAQAVYKPKPGAKPAKNHAVVLVGYNNEQQYWIAKNSWGTEWADGGYFKVAFDTCSVLTADTGEAYGIAWESNTTSNAAKLKLSPGPKTGCYWYKANAGDYMSRIAWLAGIRLETFMMENVPYVMDLDAPLDGISLLVCGPRQGEYVILPPAQVAVRPAPKAASYSTPPTSDPQLEALLRLKASVDKNNTLKGWTRESGKDGKYCQWSGITCTGKVVTSINWDGSYKLQGTWPPGSAFAGLEQLQELFISTQDGLGGTLPGDWSKLERMTKIGVSYCSVKGSIPPAWGALRLTDLKLEYNELHGTIPDTFKELRTIRVLNLKDNQLTGTIPYWFGSLSKLYTLDLAYNKLSGTLPTSLGNLKQLRTLVLSNNELVGPLPGSFKGLTSIDQLFLANNHLEGSVPSSSGSMEIVHLYLVNNPRLTGCLPKAWSESDNWVEFEGTKLKRC